MFRLNPETAHWLSEQTLKHESIWRLFKHDPPASLSTQLAGTTLPSPVGAAAGLDKRGIFLSTLLALGFGFTVGGTFTLLPQPGNAKPRMIRLPGEQALLNAMGFPNPGVDKGVHNLAKRVQQKNQIFASISGINEEDILTVAEKLIPHVSALELNISSPNTSGLKVFHNTQRLNPLIRELTQLGIELFVKVPPWKPISQKTSPGLTLATASMEAGAQGVIVSNTRPRQDARLATGQGGLSGVPLFVSAVAMVQEARQVLGDQAIIVGCGGVASASDAWQMLAAGANAVQLYTALVYLGLALPRQINRALATMMEVAGISSVADISGPPPKL